MSEIFVPNYFGTQYFVCRLCGGMQITTFSATMPDGSEVIHADAEFAALLYPMKKPTTRVQVVEVPGKEELLCDACWKHRREEAVAKELMA